MTYYLMLIAVAILGSLLPSSAVRRLGPRLGAMDRPKPLSIHSTPTARTGGLAVLAGFLLAVGCGVLFAPGMTPDDKTALLGLVFAGVLVAFIGLLDDVGHIPTRVEASSLLIPALLVVPLGIRVEFVPVAYVSVPLTLFYIIGGCSAMNLIDGMDGLAGSAAAIAAFFFAMLSLSRGEAVAATGS